MKAPRLDALEKWVDRALRELPAEPAPAELAERVTAELARRAARPWWQCSPAAWPLALRLALIAAPLALAAFASPLPALLSEVARILEALQVVAIALRAVGWALWQEVPTTWLPAALAVICLGVSASFGLGLMARRWLVPAR